MKIPKETYRLILVIQAVLFYALHLLFYLGEMFKIFGSRSFEPFNPDWTTGSPFNLLDILLSQFIIILISLGLCIYIWLKALVKENSIRQIRYLVLLLFTYIAYYVSMFILYTQTGNLDGNYWQLGLVILNTIHLMYCIQLIVPRKFKVLGILLVALLLCGWLVFGRFYVWDVHNDQYVGPLYPTKEYVAG